MQIYNQKYLNIAEDILRYGHQREGRNGVVRSIPFQDLMFDMRNDYFPLITSRKIYYDGVFGEYAAMIRGPKNIKDFQKWGCNYWNEFGDPDTGELRLSYGNSWLDFNGVNQVEELLYNLKHHRYDRRHIITAWNPKGMQDLTLPPCHFLYQFYVDQTVASFDHARNGPNDNDTSDTLSMIMYSRSGDWMVGVPSDMVFGATMLAHISALVNLKPGTLKLFVADAHIYLEHFTKAQEQIENGYRWVDAKYSIQPQVGLNYNEFQPKHMDIYNYEPKGSIKYELKT